MWSDPIMTEIKNCLWKSDHEIKFEHEKVNMFCELHWSFGLLERKIISDAYASMFYK